MKRNLTFLLFLACVGMQAQTNLTDASGHKQGKWVKRYESGKIRYTGTFKNDIPVGVFTYFYERRGGKMSEITYRVNSGVGYAKMYHTSGVLQAEGMYRGQKKDSVWTYYSRDGKLTQRETFVDGMISGPQLTYWPNGNQSQRIDFLEGKEHGVWIRKWEDGKKRTVGAYLNGQLQGQCKYFNEEGRLLAQGEYNNGKKHKTWYYFEDGRVSRQEVYRYGKLESEKSFDK